MKWREVTINWSEKLREWEKLYCIDQRAQKMNEKCGSSSKLPSTIPGKNFEQLNFFSTFHSWRSHNYQITGEKVYLIKFCLRSILRRKITRAAEALRYLLSKVVQKCLTTSLMETSLKNIGRLVRSVSTFSDKNCWSRNCFLWVQKNFLSGRIIKNIKRNFFDWCWTLVFTIPQNRKIQHFSIEIFSSTCHYKCLEK